MALNSMQDYDEVSGILKMSASFILYWSDQIRLESFRAFSNNSVEQKGTTIKYIVNRHKYLTLNNIIIKCSSF
jgi:hypothetical protein